MAETLQFSGEELKALVVTQLGILQEADFEKASQMAQRLRIPLTQVLVEQYHISFEFILKQFAQCWNVDFIALKLSHVQWNAFQLVTEHYAQTHMLIPFERTGNQLKVAMVDPRDRHLTREVEQLTGLQTVPYLSPHLGIRRAQFLYKQNVRIMLQRSTQSVHEVSLRRRQSEDNSSVAEFFAELLEYAIVTGASDIHIEPYKYETLVRYRIDGILHHALTFSPEELPSLASRIKVLSGMRIDEKRAPQDGRIDIDVNGFEVDLRVSSLPTHWGEKIVLRVLSKDGFILDLESLGLSNIDYEIFLRNMNRPFGMILITGPTGAGKTSTLYAALNRIGKERSTLNISTIEDPVEYTVPRVNQVSINPAAGIAFASGLRALLRQDPDIIMLGEIRDQETAEIAVRAAMVGRLLLSTLHTNAATSAVLRLLDMGVEPFLLSSTLSLVMAQRLVRRICANCRVSVGLEASILNMIESRPDFKNTICILQARGVLRKTQDPLSHVRLFKGEGCAQCNGSGFSGRLGVFELFEVQESVRDLILERGDASAVRKAAIDAGMQTMFQDGLAKAFLGETTIEEVLRATL